MQADPGNNYFALFGLPESFELDASELEARYRALQRRFHPDRHAGGSDADRRLAVQRAALVNEAFRTLKDPLLRGRYLLERSGVRVDDETDTRMDPEFLMEQMTLREAVAEARAADDPGAALAALGADVARRLAAATRALGTHLAAGGARELAAARERVREMQFLYKLRDEIAALEDNLA